MGRDPATAMGTSAAQDFADVSPDRAVSGILKRRLVLPLVIFGVSFIAYALLALGHHRP